MTKEIATFDSYLRTKGLNNTRQRQLIAKHFFALDKHVSAEELYRELNKKEPSIGLVTVYRTLNLLKEAGLATERQFGDGFGRFEPVHIGKHHDHLICTNCGKIVEFERTKIEQLQEDVAKKHCFEVFDHKLELYGLCARCSKSLMRT